MPLRLPLQPKEHKIPKLGNVLVRYITVGIILDVEQITLVEPENERAKVFTYSIIAAMLDKPQLAKNEIKNLSKDSRRALIEIAIEQMGIKDEYQKVPEEMEMEDRFYQAYRNWNKKFTQSIQATFEKVYKPMVKEMLEVSTLYLQLGKQLKLQESLTSAYGEMARNSLQPLIEASQRQAKMMSELINSQMLEQMQKQIDFSLALRKSVERTQKLSDEIGPALQEAGFWISPSLPMGVFHAIVQLKEDGDATPENITKVFIEYCELDEFYILRSMIENWAKNPYFDKRQKIIEDALDAHIDGKYTLSIPALLPMVEGILIDIIGSRPKKGESMSDWVGNAIDDMCTDFMQASLKNIILAFLTGVTVYKGIDKKYFTPDMFPQWLDDNNYAAKDILNRHAILHGVFVDYPSKENSIRTFMILDVLSGFDSEEDKKKKFVVAKTTTQ